MGGAYQCANCAGQYSSAGKDTWVDPYAELSTPPAQGRSADPYSTGVDWQESQPPTKRPYWLLPLVIGVSVLLVAGVGVFLLMGRGEGTTAAEPMTAAPTPTVEETYDTEPAQPSAPETVFVTVEPSHGRTAEGSDAVATGALDADAAVDYMNSYLREVAGDPAAGWSHLTQRRQQIEDRDAYFQYWAGVASASVTDCSFDGGVGSLSCRLATVDAAGASASSDARFWLTEDAGRILIDVAGGGGADQIEAEQQFERYREQSLPLTYDERWVVELSAKRPGISDPLQVAANGSHVFYLTDIVAVHENLVSRFPGTSVLALRRADWGRQGRDLWQSVADPGNLTSEADAEAWCAASFPELSGDVLDNQCTPRQMTAPRS